MGQLRKEERSARTALTGLAAGDGQAQLSRAADRLNAEANEIQSSLAALYATLISRDATPALGGLKDTMLELEAEAEVAGALLRSVLPQAEPEEQDGKAPDGRANLRDPS
jgi:hypothetical protein